MNKIIEFVRNNVAFIMAFIVVLIVVAIMFVRASNDDLSQMIWIVLWVIGIPLLLFISFREISRGKK